LVQFDKDLTKVVESYISVLLKENFVGLEQIVGEYAKTPDESSGSDTSGEMTAGGAKMADLSNLNKKHLESVAQDFSFNYK